MFDIVIRGGMVHRGDGEAPVEADIAIQDGIIAQIGKALGPARREIDAKGQIVTPGFIDIHTHYDGQASWDDELRPSIDHGVTTAVMGNCGVGFAPVREADHDKLIKLMEGVEDIPGTALYEGLTWDWESFPDYLDALAKMPRTIDIAAMVPHDPLRVYVMGDRAVFSEPANDDDIAEMRRLTREALQAGAIGFAIAGFGTEGRLPFSLGFINLPAAVIIFSTSLFFVPLGSRIAHALNPKRLRRAFGFFLLLSAINILSGVVP